MAPAAISRQPRWRGVPLGVQVVILVVISLLAAELISVIVVFVSPPPRPEVYRVSDLADALKGGGLQNRQGRPLIRTVSTTAPTESADRAQRPRLRAERERAALAGLLQVPESRVRLILRPQSLLEQLTSGRGPEPRLGLRRPPAGASDGPPGMAPEFARLDPGGGPRTGPRRFFNRENLVFGDFVAAVQSPAGAWTIVRSSPEPFPNDWQKRIALWLLGCAMVLTPVAWLFARRITRPFDRFAAAAEALGRDPNAPPMVLSGPSEIGKAAQAFNVMQARIHRYVGDRTAMVGAISHDLRTPLARIRFKLESAPEPLKRAVMSDVDKMEQMIAAVLAFIRDASEPRQRQRLDLLSLAECVADDAGAGGGDVEIVRGYPYAVDGDPIGLQRMLANLVDNAVKYGSCARLRLFEDGREAVIEITDQGPGLPPTELERVFQPFYRSSAARTLDAASGVGLGLSVARSIARAHGGDVELAHAERGLIARVRLPLAGPAA